MRFIYDPIGQDGTREWDVDFARTIMSPEREVIEKVTGMTWPRFIAGVQSGSSVCERALLWVLMRREAPTLRFDEVSTAFEETRIDYSLSELRDMLAAAEKSTSISEDDRATAIREIAAQIVEKEAAGETAVGKAKQSRPESGTSA